jgi:hypothetical protein
VGKELKINEKSKSEGSIAGAMQNLLSQYEMTAETRSSENMREMEEAIRTFQSEFG